MPYLNENGRRGQDERSHPDKGQNTLGLPHGANRLGLQRVDDGVTSKKIGNKI